MVTSYPCSTNSQYGWVSSAHQKPIGQPVCAEMAGFEATISTRLAAPWTSFVALIASSIFITWVSRNESRRYLAVRSTYKTVMARNARVSPYAERHAVNLRHPHRAAKGRRDRRGGTCRDPPATC